MKKTKKGWRFHPEEVLLCLTTRCNLSCAHCVTPRSGNKLSEASAKRFLRGCRALGIRRIGFTGGEPFLAVDLLVNLTGYAVGHDMLFDRIMTNAAWFKDKAHLKAALGKVHAAGYDGSICVSVDAFHAQDLNKAALFIKEASSLWGRGDLISIAYTKGSRENKTMAMLKKIARLLDLRMGKAGGRIFLKGRDLFIKTEAIDLSGIGKASRLKEPWDGTWFKEDYCRGPGNIFFVMPDGSVKPCCGYATDRPELTIGNIKRGRPAGIIKKFRGQRFPTAVFSKGLSYLRKELQKRGFRFPGKTSNHCYFCYYLLTKVPRRLLNACLDA